MEKWRKIDSWSKFVILERGGELGLIDEAHYDEKNPCIWAANLTPCVQKIQSGKVLYKYDLPRLLANNHYIRENKAFINKVQESINETN